MGRARHRDRSLKELLKLADEALQADNRTTALEFIQAALERLDDDRGAAEDGIQENGADEQT